jgi:hypothetical protein
MNYDNDQRDLPRSEDYGGPGDYPEPNQQSGESTSGTYSGGTTGASMGSSEGERFGEFGDTGTGVDLTNQMDETAARSSMASGEYGASDLEGPVQYGGQYGIGTGRTSEVD